MTDAKKPEKATAETAVSPPAAGQAPTTAAALLTDQQPGEAVVRKTKLRRVVPEAYANIQSTYNNTIITLSDPLGKVLAWSSAGASGFKGTRKSTAYAASQAAQRLADKAKAYGVEKVHVQVKGIGSGREQAIRSLQVGGLTVLSISDVTPIPHGGCRPRKPRRV